MYETYGIFVKIECTKMLCLGEEGNVPWCLCNNYPYIESPGI